MSSHYSKSIAKLLICLSVTQICLTDANVIHNERPLTGKVAESPAKYTNLSPLENPIDDKEMIKSIEQQLKSQTGKPMNVKLYGFASMIDPRTYVSPYQPSVYQSLRQPLQQYTNYQQMYDQLQQSESNLSPQHSANGYPMSASDADSQYIDHQYNVGNDEQAMKVIKTYLKKYDVKRYFLKKILGDAYDREEGHDENTTFFGNKHLRRHGTAGMAAKVFGELIGLKIKKTIEGFGDTISGYAKDLTTNGFVSIGNSFSKLFRIS